MTDYRNFRLSKINEPQYKHLKLLLFWPVYGLSFLIFERVLPLQFHEVVCGLDKYIPFCEYFIVPYYMWFAFLIGILLYLLAKDIDGFKGYMWFIIISYTMTLTFYLIYPTCQNLRPTEFERDNIFTAVVTFLYGFDTNTNVCPSLHVIGMMATVFAGWKTPAMQSVKWKIFWVVSAVLVCSSTVLLKQHSIIDVAAGFVVVVIVYFLVYKTNIFLKNEERTLVNGQEHVGK